MATQNKQNMLANLSALTGVQSKIFTVLANKMNLCIGSAIHDAVMDKEDIIQLDIGIGLLSVNLVDMNVKFLPSKELKAVIKRGIDDNIDPLEFELEQALIAKLCKICDEEL